MHADPVVKRKKPFWWRWFTWQVDRRFTASPASRAEWEFELAARALKPGDVAIDCGANIGVYTEMLASRGATVFAFEPDPLAFQVLQRRVGARPNVTLRQEAVGAETATVSLYRAAAFAENPVERTQSSSVLAFKPNVATDDFVNVPQVDIAEFIASLNRPVAIMKVDIEGAEFALLERLIGAGLMDRIARMFVETHDDKIPELRDVGARVRKAIAERDVSGVNLDWK